MIDTLPPAATRADTPEDFIAKEDAWRIAMVTFAAQVNAAALAMNLNSTTDTSASSVLIGTGAKAFTVSAGKSFQGGMFLVVADAAAPSTNYMAGLVTSYAGTALVMNILTFGGSGTKASWLISQTTPITTNESRGSVAMHATTMDLWAQPNLIDGTSAAVTVTAIANAPQAGARRTLYPVAGSIITNSATFAVDGAANAIAEAGDAWQFEAVTTSTYKVHIQKKSGRAVSALPRSYLAGLGLANNGADATNDIDIAVGACRDSTNASDITLESALTKRLDAAWAVGTNAGGLDTGTIANTTYHVWAIKRSDTGVVDVLFSVSATAPTMPANYDYKRRIGSIMRESAAIVAFNQVGDEFYRKSPLLDVSASGSGAAAVTRTLGVPVGLRVKAVVNVGLYSGTSGRDSVYLSDLSNTDLAATDPNAAMAAPLWSFGGAPTSSAFRYGTGMIAVWTNTSAQIRSRQGVGGASDVLYISTLGWVDHRGRND